MLFNIIFSALVAGLSLSAAMLALSIFIAAITVDLYKSIQKKLHNLFTVAKV